MADPIQIDRISLTKLKSTGVNFSKATTTNLVPGGVGQESPYGVNPPKFTLDCSATSASAVQALREIQQNPDWKFSYIQFPTTESVHSGWYILNSVETPNNPGLGIYPVRIQATKIAASNEVRQAIVWTSASESASGWTSPSTQKFVALPVGASNLDSASGTRTAYGGTIPFLTDPTRTVATFLSASLISSCAECQCWDTETACSLTETNWTRVYGKSHSFHGDLVIQNGLMRYDTSSSVGQLGTFYVWDNVSSPSAWSPLGYLNTAVNADAANVANIVQIEVTKITPDEIRWRELRQSLTPNPVQLDFTMRRGAYAVRVKLSAFDSGISGSTGSLALKYSTGSPYNIIFNTGSSGLSTCGNLAKQTSSNYQAALSASHNWVAGFVLLNSPTQQPYTSACMPTILCESNDWAASANHIFWVYGFPYDPTQTPLLTNARNLSASIAAQAMQHVNPEATLVGAGYYA